MHSAGCPSLPEHMTVQVRALDELPCYTGIDRDEYTTNNWDNKKDGTEENVDEHIDWREEHVERADENSTPDREDPEHSYIIIDSPAKASSSIQSRSFHTADSNDIHELDDEFDGKLVQQANRLCTTKTHAYHDPLPTKNAGNLDLIVQLPLPTNLFPSLDLPDIEKSGLSTQALLNVLNSLKRRGGGSHKNDGPKIWVPSNPRGAERLPPDIVASESDLYTRRLWGLPSEDLIIKPRYLVTFTVGIKQKSNIDAAVKKGYQRWVLIISWVAPDVRGLHFTVASISSCHPSKFSENFTIMLFHYDGRTTEWDDLEWSARAIHVSTPKQTKWWYAKRFLHPDIVAPYDYIFIWDEDLGLGNFDAEEYIKLVKKHGLDISQPGLEPSSGLTWQMTKGRNDTEVHKETEERPGWCADPHLPPCAAFVEIMAPVFSREAWRCVWHMIQNDLVHGWGLDFALRRCVEVSSCAVPTNSLIEMTFFLIVLFDEQPAHEKIGVVDAQWIVHQTVPSLGSQGKAENGKAPWEGVRERCRREWTMFQDRMATAEMAYYKAMGIDPPNSTTN
ncbi:putative cytochromeB1-like [Capsicum annuum]|nr:putative cytochromeB1-like [Capsicum annuum]